MDTITDEQFQRLLDNIDQSTGSDLFGSFFDPTLLPGNDEDGSFLCFPPLPPIQEEAPPISDVPPLEDDDSTLSIATSAPENDDLPVTAPFFQRLLEEERAQQRKLSQEVEALRKTLETIRTYHIESLNPWIEHVTETLKNLGCMLEEPPASATDGEFDIKVFDRS